MSSTLEKFSPWLFTIGLFAVWDLGCRIFKIDKFILPTPSEAFMALAQFWRPLLRHSMATLLTTMAGFAIAIAFGIVVGMIVGRASVLYRGLQLVIVDY